MKIDYERSGGFTGATVKVSLDTASLPPETANGFLEAFSAAHFFELPAKLAPDRPQADAFVHRLTLDDEQHHHSVEMVDSTVPDPLQPILRQLTILARRQNRS